MAAAPAGAATPSQIYAVLDTGPGAADRLASLLTAVPLSSLLIVPAGGQTLSAATAKPLVDLAQSRHCAALLADDAALARILRADGVHLSAGDDLAARYDEARSILGQGAMIGVDAGASRHAAMALGEAGADYIAFSPLSEPANDPIAVDDAADVEDDAADLGPRSQIELIAWWCQVFEVPCVAFGCTSEDDARQFAACGADFIAVPFSGGEPMAAAVQRLKAIKAAAEGFG